MGKIELIDGYRSANHEARGAPFAHGRQRGDVREDREPSDLADSVLALIQGAFVIALSTRDEHSLEAIATTLPSVVEPPTTP